jgi:hypothetical protein
MDVVNTTDLAVCISNREAIASVQAQSVACHFADKKLTRQLRRNARGYRPG